MKKKYFKKYIFIFSLMQIWSCKTTSNSQTSAPKKNEPVFQETSKTPNIIIFLADDLGWTKYF